MRKSKFSEHQIVQILKEADSGVPVNEVWRKHGISSATCYKWKAKYGGLEASDVKRMRELEAENSKLKQMYADLSLENRALKDLITKKTLTPPEQRDAIGYLVAEHELPLRRACRAIGMATSTYYRPVRSYLKRQRDVVAPCRP